MTVQTTKLLISRRATALDWLRRRDPWSAAALVAILAVVLVGTWRAAQPTVRATPVATTQPIILIATPIPTTGPIVVLAADLRLPRAVVAYDAPGGRVLGAVDSGRAYQVLARSGLEWMQLDVNGSGLIWVRRSDLEGTVPDVATVQPTEQPIVVDQAPAAATEQPAPTVTSAPATEEPLTIIYHKPDGSVLATYRCVPYGDWRDQDPMYVHPECTPSPAP